MLSNALNAFKRFLCRLACLLVVHLLLHLHHHHVLLSQLLLEALDRGLVLSQLALRLKLTLVRLLPALLPGERLGELDRAEPHPHARGEGGAESTVPEPSTIAVASAVRGCRVDHVHRRGAHDGGGRGGGADRSLGRGGPAGGHFLEATSHASPALCGLCLGGDEGLSADHEGEEPANDSATGIEALLALIFSLLHREAASRRPGGGASGQGGASREGIGAPEGGQAGQASDQDL
mmetsp:Transcript_30498/g.59570  ORF Transcript_30498/g.59570 Transcript_30498/m.59570 type:complete len:235 (+) Transcript_30498:466-1170(+)|eukprot:CAMPEP_0173386658 /NCGR_PEP_ID=MMETSP1356-20130122/9245_1 /TAXON_ID=77927 ORGANISM="Hemiselmis virescens, Strain PCC157" /NCGR_SAMPLE_ID=MMETSP1356 /ASSEMBLY_ACC=CAM_ASM_000847 /LENGTH=234 /DNA_ID=CAMNT_0014342975 /DNA_START=458 /DNA_END=1162 /DNA_ORIENTATION=-